MSDAPARQTRLSWDTRVVAKMLKDATAAGSRWVPPDQSWLSMVDEANHRIAAMEAELKRFNAFLRGTSEFAEQRMRHLGVSD